MRSFRLPDLGEGLAEAELLEWLVSVGDEVQAGQALARVETDKAQVDVTSPSAERIERLCVEPGDRIRVGEVLVEFESDTVSTQDAGTVVGRLPGPEPKLTSAVRGSAVRAMPAARERARALGLALDSVVGTGPKGVITRADVERAAAASQDGPAAPEGDVLRGPRLAMARNMARARDAVASATLMDEVDVEAWWTPDADITVRLVRAIAAACAVEPAVNAWFDDQRLERQLHEHVDVAIAIQTREGLFAPALRDVSNATPEALRSGIDRLTEEARARSLRPEALRNATITLSNFGALAGRHAMLVVVPPQVAILGAGRIERRVTARGEEVAIRAQLPLSLSFDHRVVTGAEAARFMGALRNELEPADGAGTPSESHRNEEGNHV
jgi:pyruvate dehydrogenase E2 component (dihydrolipoamide acetyltransferase)